MKEEQKEERKEETDIVKTIPMNNWVGSLDEDDLTKDLDGKSKSVAVVALGLKAYQFTDNSTMHGICHIFARDTNKLRR